MQKMYTLEDEDDGDEETHLIPSLKAFPTNPQQEVGGFGHHQQFRVSVKNGSQDSLLIRKFVR